MKDIEEIKEKADYCLNCKVKPCSNKGCPLNNNIPEFIRNIKEGNYKQAYKILSETTVLPGICGNICPHKRQCQGSCIRGIKGEPVSIGDLEAFVFKKVTEANYKLSECWKEEINQNANVENKKVAIIGGGPAGLTCAAFLAKSGIKVTIYEKYEYLGGLLIHGIPDFRLPKEIVTSTIENILDLGIKVKYNQELGKNLILEKLKQEYDAVFLSIGANSSIKMNIEGEELQGVYGGNELLEYKLHPKYEGKTVIVVGGGNVAMDCARTAVKMGAKEVKIVYRRAIEQMPAEDKEIEEAKNEGVQFLFQNNISKIIGENNCVREIELIKTKLVKKQDDDRLVPVNIEDSNYKIDADYVIMALGSKPEKFVESLGLNLNKWGRIERNERYQTSEKNIYVGGDISGEKSTVAWASKSGREAAKYIIEDIV